jgi:flagella basal body P-ring formation protein FlgA
MRFLLFIILSFLPIIAYGGDSNDDVSENIQKALIAQIKEKLKGEEVNSSFNIEEEIEILFDQQQQDVLDNLPTTPFSIKLNSLSNISNIFTANLALSDDNKSEKIKIKGKYNRYINIPVLKNRKKAGELLTDSDLVYKKYNTSRIKSNAAINIDDLIGKMAKISIGANTPINKNDISNAFAVTKKSVVTIVYDNGNITINTTGIALESGAIGDVIKVKNAKSNAIIQAVVESANIVKIRSVN